MSYYKNTKKVGKMFARLTTGGSNPAMAERALPLIELSDRVSPASDVPIAPMTASYKYASGSGYN
ncbi:22638_t:CDS:2 [Gigaspora rosea]|nr:22638_t:CDS:2 [Gigaspora rosea]